MVTLLRRLAVAALLMGLAVAPSLAQTTPTLSYKEVWTFEQWMAFMASKLDYPGSISASLVLAGPLYGTGPPTWRQLSASDITGLSAPNLSLYAPLANPVFTGNVTMPDLTVSGVLLTGNPPGNDFPNTGLVIPNGAMAIRGGAMGCEDLGVGLSVILDGAIAAAGSGLSQYAGINGGCGSGLPALASYGSFDSAALYLLNDSHVAPVTLTGPTYDATHVYPAQPLSSSQMGKLQAGMYVLTNSIDASSRNFGSYITGFASNGASITVAGWTALGSGDSAAGQIPPATYQAGTGAAPITWLGQPTSLFTTNEVCALETNPAVKSSICTEFDVVNNTGVAQPSNLNGLSVLSLGAHSVGTGLYIAGQGGNTTGFQRDIWLANFANTGLYISQTTGSGGVGIDIEMTNGIAFNVGNSAGANNFQVYADGGVAITGSDSGYFLRVQSGGLSQLLLDTGGNMSITGGFQAQGNLSSVIGGLVINGFDAVAGGGNYPIFVRENNLSGTLINQFVLDTTGNAAVAGNLQAGNAISTILGGLTIGGFNAVAGGGNYPIFVHENNPSGSLVTQFALDTAGNASIAGGFQAQGNITAVAGGLVITGASTISNQLMIDFPGAPGLILGTSASYGTPYAGLFNGLNYLVMTDATSTYVSAPVALGSVYVRAGINDPAHQITVGGAGTYVTGGLTADNINATGNLSATGTTTLGNVTVTGTLSAASVTTASNSFTGINITGNLNGGMPVYTGDVAIGWNFTAGGSEGDFFNETSTGGFSFYNEPTSTSNGATTRWAARLASIDGTGDLDLAGGLIIRGSDGSYPIAVQIGGSNLLLLDSTGDLNIAGNLTVAAGTQTFGSRFGELLDLYSSGTGGLGFGINTNEMTAFIPGGMVFRVRSGGNAGTVVSTTDSSGNLSVAGNIGGATGAFTNGINVTGNVTVTSGKLDLTGCLIVRGSDSGYPFVVQVAGSGVNQLLLDLVGNMTIPGNFQAANGTFTGLTAAGVASLATGLIITGPDGSYSVVVKSADGTTNQLLLDSSGNLGVSGNIGGAAASFSGGLTVAGSSTLTGLATLNGGIEIAGSNGSYPIAVQIGGSNLLLLDSTGDLNTAGTFTVGSTIGFGNRITELIDLYGSGATGYGFGINDNELTAFFPGSAHMRIRAGGMSGSVVSDLDGAGDLVVAGTLTVGVGGGGAPVAYACFASGGQIVASSTACVP